MSADNEFVLADLASLEVKGPCVVFVRPREPVTTMQAHELWEGLHQLKIPNVTFLVVSDNLDIMAAGEAQMTKLGWTKIDISPNDKST